MVKIHWSWIYRIYLQKTSNADSKLDGAPVLQPGHLLGQQVIWITRPWPLYRQKRRKLAFLLNLGNDWECQKKQNFYVYLFFNAKWINKLCITAYSNQPRQMVHLLFLDDHSTQQLASRQLSRSLSILQISAVQKNFLQWQKCFLSLLSNMAATSSKWQLACSYYN